ncbi:MAG TPA: DUF1360 domain-containing protein [Mycobacteriales bacterium]|nr:DUF1360 domain-containing protein [Mycobacteriales bacterium]
MTAVERIKHRYEHGSDRPLGSFLILLTIYSSSVSAAAGVLRHKGRRLPAEFPLRDVALGMVATHKASRLLAKDPVSSPFRAPFTEFEGQSGESEVSEKVVGTGFSHAVGELVTCPFCLDMWVATAFVLGYVANPRLARTAATVLTVVTGADLLQFGYDALQRVAS